MHAEGRIAIELSGCGSRSARAVIASSRPLGLPRVFVRRDPADVARLVPMMFSVCGMAQGVACVAACETASGHVADATTRASRRLLVLGEQAREHLIRALADETAASDAAIGPELARVMRDWKELRAAIDPTGRALEIGGQTRRDPAVVRAAIATATSTIETLVIGEPIADFARRRTLHDLERWADAMNTAVQKRVHRILSRGWAGAGAVPLASLPEDAEERIACELLGPGAERFLARPSLDGRAFETTALGRQSANPLVTAVLAAHGPALLARTVAAVVELASLPGKMAAAVEGPAVLEPGRHLGQGRALGVVETARGRLVHAVEISGIEVSRYAILAPTEWNFHPRGAAAQGLAAIAAEGDGVPELARLFVAALDPCVAFELRIA